MEDSMEQRGLFPEGAFRAKNVDFGDRLSHEARQHISDIRLDRLTIRGPYVPAASELQSNHGTNVANPTALGLVINRYDGRKPVL